MKNQIFTKTISTTILAGLMVSMLPMNLAAKTLVKKLDIPREVSISPPYQKAQRPSNEAIDETIKNIITQTNLLKQIRLTINLLAIPAFGATVLMGLVLTILNPLFLPVSLTTAALAPAIALLIAKGDLQKIPSPSIDFSKKLRKLLNFVHKTDLTSIQKSLNLAKKLQKTEKKHPKTLTKKQIEAIEEFYKIIEKKIIAFLLKGLHLDHTLNTFVDMAHKQNPDLNKKVIKKYLQRIRKIRNLQFYVNAHKEKIKKQKEKQKKLKKWTRAWHTKNMKLIALKTNATYLFAKLRLKLLKLKLEKARKKYTGIKQRLASTGQKYIKEADAVTADLSKEITKQKSKKS